MKRWTTSNTDTQKPAPAREAKTGQTPAWPKGEDRTVCFAPPAVWTRYIDSRLKQFGTR